MKPWRWAPALLICVVSASTACNVVQQNRRARLVSPGMRALEDETNNHRKRKLYDSREAASGGDGKTAGGGCGCE